MIKKQLGLLAGSVMMAASSDAAINLDGNTLVVFNTAGAGSYYQLVPSSTGDSLVAGTGFAVDVTAATAALGGPIDNFAVLALASTRCSPATYPCYNYTEFLYVSEGGGLVYSGGSATSTTNGNAQNAIVNIQSFLNNANLGYNGEGTTGDADGNGFAAQYLVSNANGSIVFNEQTLTHSTNAQLLPGTISLSGSTLTYSGLGPPPPSPTSITFPTQGSLIATGTPITVTVESGSDKTYCGLFLNDILIDEDDSVPYEFSAAPLDNLAGGSYNLQASCFSTSGQQASDLITFTVNAPATITGDITNDIEQAAIASGTITATDPDGLTDGSYFTLKTDATYGQALINPESGFWIYLADLNYYGPDPFTITVTDDLNYTTDQEISINVQCFDDDEDTVCNVEDNCPAISNPLQEDLDFDDEGDACDADIDGDTYANGIDAFPNDPSEWFDTDGDNTGDNTDNCINKINVDQSDIDSDTLGDVCDDDMDNDGVPNIVELRFGGNQTDANDAATSLTNFALYAENAEADDDFDGFSNTVELAANTNPNDASDAPQAELTILEALSITKTVPAMGGIGLFVMFSSLIGLGLLKRKKKY
ncbi:thrombospondin type 3 repeat-containing protein [Pseudomonadales bacterium]|nr:thrombospondin type 3 repeat-containing protein [Pseudomonadales bacterium]